MLNAKITQISRRNIRVVAALTACTAGAGLYFLGSQPFAVGFFPPPWDKLAHLVTFALIGGAIGFASEQRGWRMGLCCTAGALVLGAMDEAHQAFLPGRQASWADLGADLLGGLLGAALLGARYELARRRTSRR